MLLPFIAVKPVLEQSLLILIQWLENSCSCCIAPTNALVQNSVHAQEHWIIVKTCKKNILIEKDFCYYGKYFVIMLR